jgi:hypothetical protein
MRARRCQHRVARPRIGARVIWRCFIVLVVFMSLRASTTKSQVSAEDRSLIVLQSREAKSVPDCGAERLDARNEILKSSHIVVLAVPKRGESSLQGVMKCFGPGWEQVPFREKNGVVQIPSGEIFVKFKDGTSEELIQKTFESNGLKVIGEPKSPHSAYKVSSQIDSAARSLEIVRLVGKSPFVEYAEPNWIIVRAKTP